MPPSMPPADSVPARDEAWRSCNLSAARAPGNRTLLSCAFPALYTPAFTPLQLRVLRDGSLLYNRTIQVDQVGRWGRARIGVSQRWPLSPRTPGRGRGPGPNLGSPPAPASVSGRGPDPDPARIVPLIQPPVTRPVFPDQARIGAPPPSPTRSPRLGSGWGPHPSPPRPSQSRPIGLESGS